MSISSHSDSELNETEYDSQSPFGKLKSSINMNRSNSTDLLHSLEKKLHGPLQKHTKKLKGSGSVSKQIDHSVVAQWLESHPIFPFCIPFLLQLFAEKEMKILVVE
jgi:hypothetical protein